MNVLKRIFETKHREVARAKEVAPLADLVARSADRPPTLGFARSLADADGLALIAEVKKASPSKGVIRPNFDPVQVATAYERAGATALSVLTDVTYFQGSSENLMLARKATKLPILRKDFIDDPYQIYEARVWGADAILLIVSALSPDQICDLAGLAGELGLDALVEVHTAEEAEIAVKAQSRLIGVNNRDLTDFHTDVAISEAILPLLGGAIKVSESALETRADLDRVEAAGAKAVLIGTSFCSAPDIEAKVREVMGR